MKYSFYKDEVIIPSGNYRIGDDRFYPEETPIITVELSAFSIDVTEVTNRQFQQFVTATGYVTRAERGLPEKQFNHLPETLRAPGSAVFTPHLPGAESTLTNWWRFVEGASWRTPFGPESSIHDKEHHPVVHVAFEDALAYAAWRGRRLPT
ncbi:MAG: SUMF1/EgtB/PvdO family nonheme iron enzyme, partial [Pseudomonadota bacterium]